LKDHRNSIGKNQPIYSFADFYKKISKETATIIQIFQLNTL